MISEIIQYGLKIETYQSKRNHVCLVQYKEHKYVLKEMNDQSLWKKEIGVLRQLSSAGVSVPCIIEAEYPYIVLEYLDGELLLDLFNEYEEKCCGQSDMQQLIEMWLEWLEGFYNTTKLLFGETYICLDINFRNYILREKNCRLQMYWIDFEQCRPGIIEEDMGRIMAFALMYEPVDTEWKKEFIRLFVKMAVERFDLNKALVQKEYEQELLAMKIRRKYKNNVK